MDVEENLFITESLTIPGAELDVRASRSSGPGGQHVNKTSSKISLRWSIIESTVLSLRARTTLLKKLAARLVGEGELLIHVESERSQQRNREIARERLAELVKKALTPVKPRVKTRPSLASKNRRVDSKKKRGLLKKQRTDSGD